MYRAIIEIDSADRAILVDWVIDRGQISGTRIAPSSNRIYSGFLAPNKIPLSTIPLEITSDGILPVLDQVTIDISDPLALKSAKDSKIKAVNSQFDSFMAQFAPTSYVLYSYISSLQTDLNVSPGYRWVAGVNQRWALIIKSILDAKTIDEVKNIQLDFRDFEDNKPDLPTITPAEPLFTMTSAIMSSYDKDLTIPPESSAKLSYGSKKIPVAAYMITSVHSTRERYLSNHTVAPCIIQPSILLFRKVDGGSESAQSVLNSGVLIPSEVQRLEFEVPYGYRVSKINLVLSSPFSISTIRSGDFVQESVGDYVSVVITGGQTSFTVETDSSEIGPLVIFGNYMTTGNQVDQEIPLSAGSVSLESIGGHNITYSVLGSDNQVILSGNSVTQNCFSVSEGCRLHVVFPPSSEQMFLKIIETPSNHLKTTSNIRFSYNVDLKELEVFNDGAEDLSGQLTLLSVNPPY